MHADRFFFACHLTDRSSNAKTLPFVLSLSKDLFTISVRTRLLLACHSRFSPGNFFADSLDRTVIY